MDDLETAQNARKECAAMAKEQLLTLEDAVVAFKEDGDGKIDRAINLTAPGAMGGAWLGGLIGAFAGSVTGGVGLTIASLAGGAAGGALSGWMMDAGISDDMTKKTADSLEQDKAILFIAGRTGAPDKILERLRKSGGTVVTSNLIEDADKHINSILSGGSA